MKTHQLALLLAAVLTPLSAHAASVTYTFSSGSRSATALFEQSGLNLIITLTNTSTADVLVPVDVLTAVYFRVTGDPLLTRTSAVVPLTSEVYDIGPGTIITPGDRIVGGEWSYLNGINPDPPANAGVSSVGLGIFGPGNRFPGDNLLGPDSPDGLQYGIASASDDVTTGNGGVSTHLIKNAVIFTLGGWSGEPDALITSASFQYGTDLSEPQFEAQIVPEPSTLALVCLGVLGLVFFRGRRR